ncbi:MAG: Sulfurtransferase [Pedosphaera sp.]|nr:Sulfurtransferase [Pedosphaera sp.]
MNTKLKIPDPAKAKEFFEDKMTFTTGPVELDRMIKAHENINVVDVRAEEDYQKGHIPGAINLPHDKWSTLEGLSKDKANVLYCYTQVCHLAATAACEFAAKGFPVMEMEGGFEAWKENDLEVEKAHHDRMFTFRH